MSLFKRTFVVTLHVKTRIFFIIWKVCQCASDVLIDILEDLSERSVFLLFSFVVLPSAALSNVVTCPQS